MLHNRSVNKRRLPQLAMLGPEECAATLLTICWVDEQACKHETVVNDTQLCNAKSRQMKTGESQS